MALYSYLKDTMRLIADLKQQLANPGDLVTYVNIARRQLAGESESVRFIGTLSLSASVQSYAFSSIAISNSNIKQALNARMIWANIASGQVWVNPRSFEYFGLYFLNEPVPTTGLPTEWSQYGQGASGTLYFYPTPDATYTVQIDMVCLPVNLQSDTDVEVIPSPWTDAVPYYAAYLAYSDAQRMDEANMMFSRYEQFTARARRFATPSVLSSQYEQQPNMMRQNQLGIRPAPKIGVQ